MKPKQSILLLAGIVLAIDLFSQSKLSLTGKVTDAQSSQPLAGASVYFPDLRRGTVAGEDGIYKIQNITQGSYLVEVSHSGYSPIIETIQLTGDVQKDFA